MSDIGWPKGQESLASESSSSSSNRTPQTPPSATASAATIISDEELNSGQLADKGTGIASSSVIDTPEDNELSSEQSLPLSPPAHILKRLTPLKRVRNSNTSPSSSSAVFPDSNTGSPPRRKTKTHKPRTLSATEVVNKVTRLQISESLKREEKKEALKQKLEKALKNREEVNKKKSENAKKFIENSRIWNSFLETHDDFKLQNSDEELEVDAGEPANVNNEFSGTPAAGLTSFLIRIDDVLKIQKSIRAHFFKSQVNTKPPLLNVLQSSDVLKKLNETSFDDVRGLILEESSKSLIRNFLHSIGAPLITPLENSTLVSETIFLLAICLLHVKVNCSKSNEFDSLFRAKLGEDAKKHYEGYRHPTFMRLHYDDDEFSNFLIEKLTNCSERLLKFFKILIDQRKVVDFKYYDMDRFNFLKAWRQYLELFLILSDDRDTKLLHLLFKANDVLVSSLAIQEHINENEYIGFDNHELQRVVGCLTETLLDQKKEIVASVKYLSKVQPRWGISFSYKGHRWLTRGFTLEQKRSQLYETYIFWTSSSGTALNIIPPALPGITTNEWRRYLLLGVYRNLDNWVKNLTKYRTLVAPRTLRSGFRRSSYPFAAQISSSRHTNVCYRPSIEHVNFALKIEDDFNILFEKIIICREIKEDFKPVASLIVTKSLKFLRDLSCLLTDHHQLELFYESLAQILDSVRKFIPCELENEIPFETISNEIYDDYGKFEVFIYSFCVVLKTLGAEKYTAYSKFGISKDSLNKFEVLAKSCELKVDIEKVGNGEQFDVILLAWRGLMIEMTSIWIHHFKTSRIALHRKTYGFIDRFYFSKYILHPEFDLDVLRRNWKFEVRNTCISQFIEVESPLNHSVTCLRADKNKMTCEFIMAKMFDLIKNGSEKLRLPLTFDVCHPFIIEQVNNYKLILQVIFIQFAVDYFLGHTPLVLTGEENLNNGIDYDTMNKSIIKPNIPKLGRSIFKYFKDEDVIINPNFMLDDCDIQNILEIIKTHIEDKIANDPRTRDLYSHSGNSSDGYDKLARNNSTESSLAGVLKKIKYYPFLAKQCNTGFYLGVSQRWKAEGFKGMDGYVEGVEKEFHAMAFEMRKIIRVSCCVFGDLIY